MIRNISKVFLQTGIYNNPILKPKLALNYVNFYRFSQIPRLDDQPQIEEKIKALEESQPFFDRLVYFDPDVMANLPFWFQRFDPLIETVKDQLVVMHSYGIPWWAVISLTCLACRTTILPLIYLQIQRANRLTAIAPVIIQLKKITEKSKMPKYQKWGHFLKGTFQIVRQQNLKVFRLFLYNLFHFPIIFTMVFSIRRLLIEQSVKETSFLWIPSFAGVDPYYIIPFFTVGCYYYNFQRFITPENRHTIMSKLRNIAQVLMILWLPLLCNWPSAIGWYMCSNAIISIIQTTVLIQPAFLRLVEPKMLLYQYMLRIVEYDKTQSDALIESIKTGEESLKDRAISEEVLVQQTQEMLKKLNAEIYDDIQEQQKQQDNQQNEDQQIKDSLHNQELKF